MLYRKMHKSGRELSILGYGCMRLPLQKDGTVDARRSVEAIRYAIDHGVSYVDTAYVYHNGESEVVLGKALKDGYREKVRLATKLPVWMVQTREDMDKFLDEQMKKLQTDHIDFYLVHGLDAERWENMCRLGVKEFLDKALADGRIRYAGFSFHDKADSFKPIVDGYPWTFCQIQYNYMDENYQAGTAGLKYAASRGLDVIVMEPLRGGGLTGHVPEVDKIWAGTGLKRSPAEWGLRWVWNHPEVTVVLSGMSSLDQVKENLKTTESGKPDSMTPAELKACRQVTEIYRKRMKVDCTGCGYCMPCPNGVQIPSCFSMYNTAAMFENHADMKKAYYMFIGDAGCASKCIECGECEEKCPQHIQITEKLKEVKEEFGK
jgi:hypothetical protein